MCGVIGVIGSKNAAYEIYTGLFCLQHRGQDAAGIMTFDGSEVHLKKGHGLVSQLFSQEDLKMLRGDIGIGHVRYPTVGSNSSEDAQPFFVNYPYGIGLAHNGNLVNHWQLRDNLNRNSRRILSSHCDAEVIVNMLADELVNNGKIKGREEIFNAVELTMKKLNGSYSAVALFANEGLLAFRDPHGIRPFIFGVKEQDGRKSYAFASETVALDILGYSVINDIGPGEAVFVDMKGNVTSKKITDEKPAHCMFEWVYFSRPDSVVEKIGVYEARLELGRQLGKEWLKTGREADVVIPVPDTGRTASTGFEEVTGMARREGLIKNRYSDRTFIMATQVMREDAVKLKLNPIIDEIRGKRIILVDDSLVRGTTSKKLIAMVRRAGATEVHLALTCPMIKYPCFYGVDMASHKELIAANKTLEEIAKEIGADSVIYQTLDGLKQSIKKRLCTACLEGRYPTDISEDELNFAEKEREKERSLIDFMGNGNGKGSAGR
jgi:amidophosphoribosyltransferase